MGGQSIRRVGTKTFIIRGDVWTDAAAKDSATRISVKPFSSAYFKLMETIPELREVFALGDKVVVSGKSIVIEISSSGVENLSDADLKRITTQW